MRTINVEKNGKNHQTLKGAGGDYGRLEFVPTRKLYVLIVPNCPDSRRSNKTLQKKEGSLFRSPLNSFFSVPTPALSGSGSQGYLLSFLHFVNANCSTPSEKRRYLTY
jgi:hypothetical protein